MFIRLFKLPTSNCGFTLIELIICITILGMLLMYMTRILTFNIKLVKTESDVIQDSANSRMAMNDILKVLRGNDYQNIFIEGTNMLASNSGLLLDPQGRATNINSAKLWYCYDFTKGYGNLEDLTNNILAEYVRSIVFIDKNTYACLMITSGEDANRANTVNCCIPLRVYEAENGTLNNASVDTTYSGYSGTGYVTYNANNGTIQLTVDDLPLGMYMYQFRYSSGINNSTVQITVNGTNIETLALNPTGDFNTWILASSTASSALNAGANTIILTIASNNQNLCNIDFLRIVQI